VNQDGIISIALKQWAVILAEARRDFSVQNKQTSPGTHLLNAYWGFFLKVEWPGCGVGWPLTSI